ncbi:hypothetical protein ACJJTC_007419 [Scirpophaga incertulas]
MAVSPSFNILDYKISNMDSSAFYVPEYVSNEEESNIMSSVYAAPKPKWTQLSNRRLQNWGGIPHVKGMIAETIPPWLEAYLKQIHSLGLMNGKQPNHVLVNEYLPGQGIMPHLDGSLFYPTITTISLGSHTILKFFEPNMEEDKKSMSHVFSLLLEPRSLLVLQDKLFHYYLHGIQDIKKDVLDQSIANLSMCSKKYVLGKTLERNTRISLTIRHVPRTSSFKINIGNKR